MLAAGCWLLASESALPALTVLVAHTQGGLWECTTIDSERQDGFDPRVVEALRFSLIPLELERPATRKGRICEQVSIVAHHLGAGAVDISPAAR
jgi:hypothetical protein